MGHLALTAGVPERFLSLHGQLYVEEKNGVWSELVCGLHGGCDRCLTEAVGKPQCD